MSLFSGPAGIQNKTLVEFKAGRLFKEGGLVKPDKRKGKLILSQSLEDGLLHIQWKDRLTGVVDQDLIILPKGATFKRIEKVTSGRVYVLKMSDGEEEHFYWMQEPKEDKDAEYEKTINESIQSPPSTGMRAGTEGGDASQLMSMFGLDRPSQRGGPSGEAGSPSGAAPSGLDVESIRNIISGLTRGSSSGGAASRQTSDIALRDILTSESIMNVLSDDPSIAPRLVQHLPEGTEPYEVIEHVLSPQFQQAVDVFDAAIKTGQVAGIASSIGLNPAVVSRSGGGVEGLLNAMAEQEEKAEEETKEEGKEEEDKDKDGDSEMKDAEQ